MNRSPSIKKNFVWNTILTGSNVLFPLVTFPYISRALQATAMGKVDFSTTLVNYFCMFASLGIPTYGIRACAAVRDNRKKLSKVVHELLFINAITTIFAYICLILVIWGVPRLKRDNVLFLLTGINLLLNLLNTSWLYSALEDYRYITIRSVIIKFISLILIIAIIHSPEDYLKYAIINAFSVSAGNILNFIHSKKYVTYQKIHNYEIRCHIKSIFIFFATSVAISIYTNLDILMIGFMVGDMSVGYYSAALKIRSAAAAFVTILSTILLPRLSYYVANGDYEKFHVLIKGSFNYALLLSLPLTVFFMTHATSSIILLSGSGFQDAGQILFCLMPTVLFAGMSNVTGTQLLVPFGREKQLLISIIIGAFIDFVLNLYFIPRYAAVGAAIATSVAELAVLQVQIAVSKKYIKEMFICKDVVSVVAALSIAFVLSFFWGLLQIGNLIINLSFNFVIFMGCYLLLLYVFRNSFLMDILKHKNLNLK